MERLNKILVGLLILTLVFAVGWPEEVAGQKQALDSQKELKQEIQALNLINGLYLSPEQMRFIIEQARRAEDIRETFLMKHQRNSEDSTLALKRLKGELEENKGLVSEDVAREIHQSNRKKHKLRGDYERQISELVAQVKDNLTQKQLYIIEQFKPCLVPPKGPARVGQATNHTGGVKQLERVRKMPAHQYALKKYEFTERILERVFLHKSKGVEIDKEQLRDEILSIFNEARSLSELDFSLKKEELAKELKEVLRPEKKTVDIDARIERFLLQPTIASILEKRLKI